MGKASREKGKRGERYWAKLLAPIWPGARRAYAQSRSGSDAPDIEGTPFWVEVKVGKRPSVRAALKQAQAATDGRDVIVLIKDDRCEPFVAMPWSTAEVMMDAYAKEWGVD